MAHRPCNFPVVGFSIEAMDGTAQTSRYLSSTTGNTTLPPAKVLTNAHSCSPTMRKSHVTVHLDGAIRCSGLATLSDLRPLHASSTRPPSFLPLLTEHGLLRQNRVPFPRAPLAHPERLLRTPTSASCAPTSASCAPTSALACHHERPAHHERIGMASRSSMTTTSASCAPRYGRHTRSVISLHLRRMHTDECVSYSRVDGRAPTVMRLPRTHDTDATRDPRLHLMAHRVRRCWKSSLDPRHSSSAPPPKRQLTQSKRATCNWSPSA
jgi:hypothetical protein